MAKTVQSKQLDICEIFLFLVKRIQIVIIAIVRTTYILLRGMSHILYYHDIL